MVLILTVKELEKKNKALKERKDAEKWVTDILGKKHKGFVAPTESSILLKDYVTKWFTEYKINTLSTNTIANYNSRIDMHIIPKLGNYKVNKITNEVVQDFYNSLINEGQAIKCKKDSWNVG